MPTGEMKNHSTDNMELPKQQVSACGPECGCHAPGPSGRKRWIVGVIVLIAAAAFVARAVTKNHETSPVKTASGFATMSTCDQAPAPNAVSVSPIDR